MLGLHGAPHMDQIFVIFVILMMEQVFVVAVLVSLCSPLQVIFSSEIHLNSMESMKNVPAHL